VRASSQRELSDEKSDCGLAVKSVMEIDFLEQMGQFQEENYTIADGGGNDTLDERTVTGMVNTLMTLSLMCGTMLISAEVESGPAEDVAVQQSKCR